jgi:hypothetical protein
MDLQHEPNSAGDSGEFAALSDGLRRMYHAPFPGAGAEARDEAIRLAIHRQFAGATRSRWRIRRLAPWAAAAATITLACFAWFTLNRQHAATPPAIAQFNSMDVDRNGRINILDAFALARQLHSGQPAEQRLDVNNDGVVDARDVDAIAMEAVSLNGGAAS